MEGKMKTLKFKSLLIAVVAIVGATGLFSGNAFGQTSTTNSMSGLKQDRLIINRDLSSVSLQQQKVTSLEKKWKDERASGVKNPSTRCDLMKAKADLNKDKSYLVADKSGLLKQHQAMIDKRKAI